MGRSNVSSLCSKITFEPPLPEEKQTAIQKLGFGLLNKLALYFESSFWSANEDYFGITSVDPERRGENFLFWNMQRYVTADLNVRIR